MRGVPLILLSSVGFASMAVLARSLTGRLPIGQLVEIRFLIGLAACALLFSVLRRRPRTTRPVLWALRGVFGGCAVLLYFFAMDHIEVGPATLLHFTAPCWAALFAALFLGEKVTGNLIAGITVATIGAGIVVWGTSDPARPFEMTIGLWAGVVSSICSGAAMTTIKALREETDAITVFLSFSIFGSLVAAPFAVTSWSPIDTATLWTAVAMGVLAAVAQLVFTYAFAFVPASVGSASTQLTPALAWAMGVLWLRERVTLLALAGAVMCVGGVLWAVTMGIRRTAPL